MRTSKKKEMSRRKFIGLAAAGSAFTIVPRHVLRGTGYTAPSDKVNIACVGVGGKGRTDIESASKENVVALCDVDDARMALTIYKDAEKNPQLLKAAKYKDFRHAGAHPRVPRAAIRGLDDMAGLSASGAATPATPYECTTLPLAASEPDDVKGPVRQLRDPAIFEDDGRIVLFYSVCGEQGIAAPEITVE